MQAVNGGSLLASERIRPGYGGGDRPIGQIQTTRSDTWRAAVALRGELDMASVPSLRAELGRHLEAGRRLIRVDAGSITFIDAAVISELVEASQRCQAERGSLILTNVPARVRHIIEIAGLETLLLIDTAKQA